MDGHQVLIVLNLIVKKNIYGAVPNDNDTVLGVSILLYISIKKIKERNRKRSDNNALLLTRHHLHAAM